MSTPSASTPAPVERWDKFSVLMFVAIPLLLGGIAFGIWVSTFPAKHRQQTREHLKYIGLALHQYHDAVGHFPAAYRLGADGQPAQSWRTALLPYLGETALSDAYRSDEDWQSEQNRTLLNRRPVVYSSPGFEPPKPSQTRFVAVVGPGTMWPEQYAMSIDDISDGLSSTVMVLESPTVTPEWTEPRDLPHIEAIALTENKERGTTNLLLADGSVRESPTSLYPRETMNRVLTARSGRPRAGVKWPDDVDESRGRLPTPKPSTAFQHIQIAATPNVPLKAGTNTIYCCTMQLTWQELAKSVGGPPQIVGGSPIADSLNSQPFPIEALNTKDYLAATTTLAGISELRAEMTRKFPGATSELMSAPRPDAPNQIVMYSFLEKSLPFEAKYEALKMPLTFNAAFDRMIDVPTFGFLDLDSHRTRDKEWIEQTKVLRYQPSGEIIVRLDSRGRTEEIFVAQMPRPETLEAGIQAVLGAAADSPLSLGKGDELAIPILMLGVRHEYLELSGKSVVDFLPIITVQQIIRFRLDEAGAELDSESMADFLNGASPPPGHPWKLIFDRPFLVMLRQRGAERPYFAMWVEDPRLD